MGVDTRSGRIATVMYQTEIDEERKKLLAQGRPTLVIPDLLPTPSDQKSTTRGFTIVGLVLVGMYWWTYP